MTDQNARIQRGVRDLAAAPASPGHAPATLAAGDRPANDSLGWPRRLRLLAGAVLLLLLAALLGVWDAELSAALRGDWIGGDLRRLILLAEVYGHGAGVAMILITIAVLHPAGRRHLPRIALYAFGAGLAANIVKLMVARIRPHSLAESADSFVALFPLWTLGEQSLTHAMQSFPSGHTATAVGLAVGMSRLYPHGRWLFATFASLAGLQRLIVGAHYPSDVLCAAALAMLVATLLVDSRRIGQLLDRLENRGRAKRADVERALAEPAEPPQRASAA